MNHVIPTRTPAVSGAPDAAVLLAVLAGIAGARAVVAGIGLVLNLAEVQSAAFSWVAGIVGGRGLLGITVLVVLGLLSSLDARGTTGPLRLAALATAGLAFVWAWGTRLLPDSLRPENAIALFLLFELVPMVAALVFAHWLGALLVARSRQPAVTLATWWATLVTILVVALPPLYLADFFANVVVWGVVSVDLLRLRKLL